MKMKDTPCLSGILQADDGEHDDDSGGDGDDGDDGEDDVHLLSERASYKLVVNSHLWSDCEYIVIFPSYPFGCLRELPMFD